MGTNKFHFTQKTFWLIPAVLALVMTAVFFIKSCIPPNLPDPFRIPYNLVVDFSHYACSPSVATSENNVYVIYYEAIFDNLILIKSTDKGETWPLINRRNIDDQNSTGIHPSLTLSNKNLYVSYYDDTEKNLKFAKSTDEGNQWFSAVVDSIGTVGKFSSIAVEDENVYIAYTCSTENQIKLAHSTDGGLTWSRNLQTVVDTKAYAQTSRFLSVEGGKIYISYQDIINNNLKTAIFENEEGNWRVITVDKTTNSGISATNIIFHDCIFILYYILGNEKTKVRLASNSTIFSSENWNIIDIDSVNSNLCNLLINTPSMACNDTSLFAQYYIGISILAKSRDLGITWEKLQTEQYNEYYDDWCVRSEKDIAVENNNVYVSSRIDFTGYLNSWSNILCLSKSSDSGENWNFNVFIDEFLLCYNNGVLPIYFNRFGIFPTLTYDGINHYIAYWADTLLRVARISEFYKKVDFISEIDFSINRNHLPPDIQTSQDGKKIYLAYITSHDINAFWLKMAISEDSGKTWFKSVIDTYPSPYSPQMCVNSEKIYVAYNRYILPSGCLVVSEDNGVTWNLLLYAGSDFYGNYSNNIVLADENRIFYFYSIQEDNNDTLMLARSENYGRTWEHIVVDPNYQGYYPPCQSMQAYILNNELYLSYGKTFHLAKSTDLGLTWRIVDLPLHDYRFEMNSTGIIYITYLITSENREQNLYIVKSTDDGITWNLDHPVIINPDSHNVGDYYDMNLISKKLFIAYYENNTNTLRFTSSVTSGDSWPEWTE